MKKKLNSENDLSYSDSEKIRDIIDNQLRHQKNTDLIRDIALDVQKNKFFEYFSKGTFYFISLIITSSATYYFSTSNQREPTEQQKNLIVEPKAQDILNRSNNNTK